MKNDYEIRGNVTAILLNSRKYGKMETLISTSKLKLVDSLKNSWYPYYQKDTNTFVVKGNFLKADGGGSVRLHRWLLNAPETMLVDHINHDTLNNTDYNLRLANSSQNNQNRKGPQKNGTSGVRGVTWHKRIGKWHAKIRLNRKTRHIGYYENIDDAEKAVKEARSKMMPYSDEALAN